MRIPITAGNWKMYKTIDESVAFARALIPHVAEYPSVDCVVFPSFMALSAVSDILDDTHIKVGAQNVHWESEGAYTSQISPTMLQGIVDYVLIGHSETRAYLNETDESVNHKVKAALAHGFKIIIAVGESLEQNQAGQTESFVSGQVRAALADVTATHMQQITIAYEPIWAIGTGKSASGTMANDIVNRAIRTPVRHLYDDSIADALRIQYGGSVKPTNIAEFMSQPHIDGTLVGGACLDVDSFSDLVKITAETTKV